MSVCLTVLLLSDRPEVTEKPDSSETVHVPSPEPGKTRPGPGQAESDSGPTETENPPGPAASASAAYTEEEQSQTTRVWDSTADSGTHPETEDQSPAGQEGEAVPETPEVLGENADVNIVNGNEETSTTEHSNVPDPGPNKSPKKSRTSSPGEVCDIFKIFVFSSGVGLDPVFPCSTRHTGL